MVRAKKVFRRRPRGRKVIRRKKRTYGRRRIGGSWMPFGISRMAKLKYCDTFTINPGVGSVGTYVFSANGLYDPNISGLGHQPYGFDQLAALYNHYMVVGSKITVTPTFSDNNVIVGIKLSDQTTLNTSAPMELMEQPGFRKKIYLQQASVVRAGVSCNFSLRKFFGIRGPILPNSAYSAYQTANPSEQAYYIVCLAPVVAAGDIVNTSFTVTIQYTAKWTGPKELVAS